MIIFAVDAIVLNETYSTKGVMNGTAEEVLRGSLQDILITTRVAAMDVAIDCLMACRRYSSIIFCRRG